MNEQIKVLAIHAGAGEWGDSVIPAMMNIEKFAELIVQECVEICRSEDWEDQQGWGKLYAHKIKKHFEVK